MSLWPIRVRVWDASAGGEIIFRRFWSKCLRFVTTSNIVKQLNQDAEIPFRRRKYPIDNGLPRMGCHLLDFSEHRTWTNRHSMFFATSWIPIRIVPLLFSDTIHTCVHRWFIKGQEDIRRIMETVSQHLYGLVLFSMYLRNGLHSFKVRQIRYG